MIAIVISNPAYIIISFMVFIIYSFIYLSTNGLLQNNKDTMLDKPNTKSFDSLKGGRGVGVSEADRVRINQILNNNNSEDGEEFIFDENTRIDSSTLNDNKIEPELKEESSEKKKQLDDSENSKSNSIETFENDDDDEHVWNAVIVDEDENQLELESDTIGNMSESELVLLSTLKAQMLENPEIIPNLIEECMAANEAVNRFAIETNNRIEVIVSNLLDSRERVIFNLFPRYKNEQAA